MKTNRVSKLVVLVLLLILERSLYSLETWLLSPTSQYVKGNTLSQ
jgi:hypothetical protein